MSTPRCVCGGRGLRLVDRRPVLLSDELLRLVEHAMGEAIHEAGATESSVRARLLRAYVIPHFMRVLRDHRVAAARHRRGLGGVRRLTGPMAKRLALVSRMPMGGLRPSETSRDA